MKELKIGDYLFCVNPSPEFYGRIFKITWLTITKAGVDCLHLDGTVSQPSGAISKEGRQDDGQPWNRPATPAEVLYAKLMGLL